MSEPYVACSNIIEHNDGIVLVEETKPHIAGLFSLPGGSPQAGESLNETAAREGEEETGLVLVAESVVDCYRHYSPRGGRNLQVVVFASRVIGGVLRTSQEHPSVAPYSYEAIAAMAGQKKLRSPIIEQAVHDYRRGLRHNLTMLETI